jgi:hypothetical protein
MSHTSQRRGLEKSSHEEIIVVGAYPGKYKNINGIQSAMEELAVKMLEHGPRNWLSKNYTDINIPQVGIFKGMLRALKWIMPNRINEFLFKASARRSTVITALYTETGRVTSLIDDLKKEWLSRNRTNGYPISIILSGLHDKIKKCCHETGTEEHTCLYSIGFYGKTGGIPSENELSLITMCGHGLISVNRVQYLIDKIRNGSLTAREAAEDIAKPCVCGIVNTERAEEIFSHIKS